MTGSSSGNAKVDLVVTPGRRPREPVVCVVAFVDLGRVGDRSHRLCHFFVQIVWFLTRFPL